MSSKIYRQAAVERLNSPEHLNTAVSVTEPKGWLAVLLMAVIFCLILVWSITGSVYTRVSARGILIRSGGMLQVASMTSGQIQEIVAEVESDIKQGQVIARIYKPDLLNQIHNLKADIADAVIADRKLVEYHRKNIAATRENYTVKRSNLRLQLENLEKRRRFFESRLEKEKVILERGLITPTEIDNTHNQLNSIIDEVNGIHLAMGEHEASILMMESKAEREMLESSTRLDELNRELRRMESTLRLQSVIESPHSGRVVEIRVRAGDVVGEGTPILTLEDPEQKMEALLYVHPADGKKIRTGMEIDISPTTVRTEEYGSILGLVTFVSKYPASPELMHQVIPNKALLEELLAEGAPLEIHADLIPDHTTPSGYKWTSSTGPKIQVQSGTMLQGSARVQDRRPITLVLPYLKKILGVQ
jgi:HlyD family secretion protein